MCSEYSSVNPLVKDFSDLQGTHLCGDLSIHFIQKFNQTNNIKAMVLAPCCLSKKKKDLTEAAKKLNVDNYIYWTLFLYHMIQATQKDISYDENVRKRILKHF